MNVTPLKNSPLGILSAAIMIFGTGCAENDLPHAVSTPTKTTTLPTPLESLPSPVCSHLSPQECLNYEHCSTNKGRPLHLKEDSLCVDFSQASEAFSCQSRDLECSEAITFAASPSQPGTCVWFPTTCIPEGWQMCDLDDAPDCSYGRP